MLLRALHWKFLLVNATFDVLLNALAVEDVAAEENQIVLQVLQAQCALLHILLYHLNCY